MLLPFSIRVAERLSIWERAVHLVYHRRLFRMVYQFVCVLRSLFGFEGGVLDLIVLIFFNSTGNFIYFKLQTMYRISLIITKSKNLDPAYKMDLDL